MRNEHPEKCVSCGEEVWLGAFFKGYFLCSNCHANCAEIIFKLKARLTKRALDLRQRARRKKVLSKKVVRVHGASQ